jgi:Raf kinase inhibitor-like YbhB/YbcL family protein
MTITSPAFEKGGTMPTEFSRNGGDHSPPLTIRDVPRDAQSLVLIMDDPDAPSGTFTHWVAFNLDPVDQQIPPAARLPDVGHGQNDWSELGYGGPRPPSGEHRYFFHLFALDCPLALPEGSRRREVDFAMRGHVIEQTELMARYAATNG